MNILVFGDSITFGESDSEEGGWVQRLKKFLESKNTKVNNFNVYNLGVCGNTSSDLIKRFDRETVTKLEDKTLLFIFAVGVNDSKLIFNKSIVSQKTFQKNLKNLIKKANKYSVKIVFIGLTPVDEARTASFWRLQLFSFKNDQIKI